jgi:hypothetical protein
MITKSITAITVPPCDLIIKDSWQAIRGFVMGMGARILLGKTMKSAYFLVHNAYFFVHILWDKAGFEGSRVPVYGVRREA